MKYGIQKEVQNTDKDRSNTLNKDNSESNKINTKCVKGDYTINAQTEKLYL